MGNHIVEISETWRRLYFFIERCYAELAHQPSPNSPFCLLDLCMKILALALALVEFIFLLSGGF